MTDELLQAQDQLSRAIDKVRAGEDKELATQVRELGDRFARILSGAIGMARIHDLENRAFEAPIREVTGSLEQLVELLGPVNLVMVEDQVYVNDIRIRFSVDQAVVGTLAEAWRKHRVGGLIFHAGLDEAAFRAIVRLVTGDADADNPREVLQARLEADGITDLQLQKPFRFRVRGETERKIKVEGRKALTRGASAVSNVWDDLAAGRSLNPLRVRRAVTDLAEMDVDDRGRGLATTPRDNSLSPIVRHSVQVATLSLLIGRALGLSDNVLSDLGVAASFHDAGYSTEEDGFPPPFGRHGAAGVRLMLKQRGFHEARVRRMLSSLEHHKAFKATPKPGLYARIIRIADDFDTLTRYRAGGPMMLPPWALARMWAAKGDLYDPQLLQLFVNSVGRYPPGSILEMAGGSWVTVISGARSADTWDKPLTLMVRTRDGRAPDFDLKFDLAKGGDIGRVLTAQDLAESETA
jgi:hypothetical protein